MLPSTQIIRSRRKTISLIIQPDGSLLVRAPFQASDKYIRELIVDKAAWIRKKQKQVRSRPASSPNHQFQAGEKFYYLGQAYPLVLSKDHRASVQWDGKKFYLPLVGKRRAKSLFTTWYKKRARAQIEEHLHFCAASMGLRYRSLRITSAKKRWGSCGARGTLNFSWRLVMAPLPVIDYVITHELVHLLEKNHSIAFWNKVKVFSPNYQQYNRWLKSNGHLLTID